MSFLLAAALSGSALSAAPDAVLARGARHDKEGWICVRLAGPPMDRGYQYGRLVPKEIAEALRVRRALWHYRTGTEWSLIVEKAFAMWGSRLDPELRAELDGMVQGLHDAGIETSRRELVAFNGLLELAWYYWPEEKKRLGTAGPEPAKQSCSSFIATGSWTHDGRIVLGHNTWFDYPQADFNVILDLRPERGHRILMQTLPGWIHSGTDFFLTDAGIVGSETTIGGFSGFDRKGIPEFVRMRRATQDAETLDAWVEIMKKGNNGGYANAWLLGDLKTNEIARLELGLKHVSYQKKTDGFFAGSNVAEHLGILRFETSENEEDVRLPSVARRVRWNRLLREYQGKIDIERAQAFLADHWDAYHERDQPSSRSLCGHSELDEQGVPDGVPFSPSGGFDSKVVDATMAVQMSFLGRFGSCDGMAFDASQFLAIHPQFDWMAGLLKSRPARPWVELRSGEDP